MFKLAVLGSVAALATAHYHPVNEDLVNEIKAKADTWVPLEVHENPLSNFSSEHVFGLLGSKIAPIDSNEALPFPEPEILTAIPATFDSRNQWAGCVHAIRDQGSCGSCWAFAATEALSDRFCIASGRSVNVVLSPEDMVSCDHGNMGCNGGYLDRAWSYLEKNGAVADSCFKYTGAARTCPTSSCPDGGAFHKYKCKSGSTVAARSISAIQSEIYNHGPMETGFTVYNDFYSYKSGVYRHVSGAVAGGHAVKIIGWGSDHWIAANSWGPNWGENGFFRIAFGQCGIDSAVYACTPQL